MNKEFAFLGNVTRPLHAHRKEEIAACRSKVDAAYLALRHCGLDQEHVADRMPMDASHLSRLIRGRRPWNDQWQRKFEQITGSLALTQWDCHERGGEFYADPVDVRKAQLKQELQALEKAA